MRAFAAYVTDARVQRNFGLRLATEPGSFHVIYWGNCPALRTLDVERLVVGLRRFLGLHGSPPSGTVRTNMAAAVRDGGAVLATRTFHERLVKDERTLRRQGLSMLEAPWADIDLRTGELVIDDSSMPVDDDGLDLLRALASPARRRDRTVATGRYPILGAVMSGATGGVMLDRPQSGYQLMRLLVDPLPDHDVTESLGNLGVFTERVRMVTAATPEEARDQVVRLGVAPRW